MLFNSYFFIFVFLPVTLAGFFLIGGMGRHRIAMTWLVGASLFFYGWWNPSYLGLIIFSILFNYAIGVSLSRTAQNGHSKTILIVGVTINLLLLGYYKYTNFAISTLSDIAGTNWHIQTIILPLAISFFTFQQIAYLVDAYRSETREYNFLHYCLFVTFFPQLIAGPIVHHKEMLPQFAKNSIYKIKYQHIAIGLSIFFIGLFKKVILADNFALYATPVFNAAEHRENIDFFMAWQGAFAYTFQLYFDFSGYSDMAIGIARLFGIKLPINFNSPYQARNIIDFWRRWHITLSRFLRDYLYFALGGNQKGKIRRYVNLLITMVLGGLWHGAGWNFIIWGALHGSYLVVNHFWRTIWKWGRGNTFYQFSSRILTFLAVVISWVFFRAETFQGATYLLGCMVNLPNSFAGPLSSLKPALEAIGFGFTGGYLAHEHITGVLWLLISLLVIWYWPNTQQLLSHYQPCYEKSGVTNKSNGSWKLPLKWRPTPLWAVTLSIVTIISLLSLSQISEFLYFQF